MVKYEPIPYSCGTLNPFFVVELQLETWNPNDPRNAKLFPKDSVPSFKAEDDERRYFEVRSCLL